MKRVVIRPKGLRWSGRNRKSGGDNFVRVWPPPENPTSEEMQAADELREFINNVCVPELLANGIPFR